jgi:hypothetical protein
LATRSASVERAPNEPGDVMVHHGAMKGMMRMCCWPSPRSQIVP